MDRCQSTIDHSRGYNPQRVPVHQHDHNQSAAQPSRPQFYNAQGVQQYVLAPTVAGNTSSLMPNTYRGSNVYSNPRQATSPVSPTIAYHHVPQSQPLPHTHHQAVPPQQDVMVKLYPDGTAYYAPVTRDLERQPQVSTNHLAMQEAQRTNVSTHHPRRSSSGTYQETRNDPWTSLTTFLKQQDEKLDTKFSDVVAHISRVDDKVEKISKAAALDDTKNRTQDILKGLAMVAEKQQVILTELQAIKTFVGFDANAKQPVYGEGNVANLWDKLTDIAFHLGEIVEKERDPDANAARHLADQIREIQRTLMTENPSPIRHEIGTSPIPSIYPNSEDMAMDRNMRTATTPRVVHHEMAVSPMRLPERKEQPPLRPPSPPSTVYHDMAISPVRPSGQDNRPPEGWLSPMAQNEQFRSDGDRRQESSHRLVSGTSNSEKPSNHPSPFQRAASKSLQTPSRRPIFKPSGFEGLGSPTSQSPKKRPGFSPANWRDEEEPTIRIFNASFEPTSASSPKQKIPPKEPEAIDDSLGGPSFAAPRAFKKRIRLSRSSTSVSVDSESSKQDSLKNVPMSTSPESPSTPKASNASPSHSVEEDDTMVVRQAASVVPLTSPRSEDEDAVASMILDVPPSSQIEPVEEFNAANEIVAGIEGEDEPSSPLQQSQTSTHPRALPPSSSPLFSSPPHVETTFSGLSPHESSNEDSSSDDSSVETPVEAPTVTNSPLIAEAKLTTPPPPETQPKLTVPAQPSPEFIEIDSSPPASEQHQSRPESRHEPSPPISIIEISSDDDDGDVLPQIAVKRPEPPKVKMEKQDENPIVDPMPIDNAEQDHGETNEVNEEPLVAITVQKATPVPEPQTPPPQSKTANMLDNLLRRQLSPITPLSGMSGDEDRPPKKAFDPKKYIATLHDDDEDVVPTKRVGKRPARSSPRFSRGGSQDSSNLAKDKTTQKKRGSSEKERTGLLKLSKRKGDNLAATRIKKRKKKLADSDEEGDVPPLKKASVRAQSDTVTVSSKAQKVEIKREETTSPSTRKSRGRPKKRRPVWPEPLPVTEGVAEPMIKCDECNFWFHYSCVAIQSDDVRLKPDEIFLCPACEVGVVQNRKNLQKNTDKSTEQYCGRPECKLESNYFLNKFIGRRRVPKNGDFVPQYLVKWEGWRLEHATWEHPQELGLERPEEYVEMLENEFRAQNLDMDRDENEDKVILLQEALDAGWRPNGGYNKRWRASHYDSEDDLHCDAPSSQ